METIVVFMKMIFAHRRLARTPNLARNSESEPRMEEAYQCHPQCKSEAAREAFQGSRHFLSALQI